MTKTKIPILEIVAAASLAVIAFTVVLLLFPEMKSEAAGTWAGAFGTFFALGGTIYLATQETRQRKREALDKARIIAPAIAMKLAALRPAMVAAIHKLKGTPKAMDLNFVGAQLAKVQLWDGSEIEPLTCLPHSCAIDLAHIREIVTIVAAKLNDLPPGLEDFQAYVSDALDLLSAGLEALDGALNVCESAYDKTEYD